MLDCSASHQSSQDRVDAHMGDAWRTPDQILGPFFPQGRKATASGDLTSTKGRHERAQGEIVEVRGRVVDRDDTVCGARLIVWQANSFGRYAHANDSNPAPLDPSFSGFAEILTDQDGAYRFKTVKPGAYPAGADWMRPPHIHFEVHGRSERLITQMYFAGEPLDASDRILMSAWPGSTDRGTPSADGQARSPRLEFRHFPHARLMSDGVAAPRRRAALSPRRPSCRQGPKGASWQASVG